jgi:urate oxidase
MSTRLTHNSYGKSCIRLAKVVRRGDHHDYFELSVDVSLEGDFVESYTAGDNTKVVATDSMKNTVYVLAKEHTFDAVDDFAGILAGHYVQTYPQVAAASVAIRQAMWKHIRVDDVPHEHAFVSGGSELRTARVRSERNATLQRWAGVTNLLVLKTTGSEFRDFVDDRYRTLKDTRDRIFATSVEAEWSYADATARDFNAEHVAIRRAMLETFANHHSLAVQQTLLAMGDAALAACGAISSIRLAMPNQHRIPFNLEPFGLSNENDIFVPTDEPFGLITGTVERK